MLQRLLDSVRQTSNANFVAYIDDDQRDLYSSVNCTKIVGPRRGCVGSANQIAKTFPSHKAYGLITDDSTVGPEGWDEWVVDSMSSAPNGVGVASPAHSRGGHVDMPFVSQRWIEATGWFAYPEAFHYVWPTITGMLGEMTWIEHATPEQFMVTHDLLPNGLADAVNDKDEKAFFQFCAVKIDDNSLLNVLARLRKAME